MAITTNSATGSSASSGSSSSTGTSAADISGQFMSLLVAQLKNQDPLNPMDPSQMTSQLTSLSSLQQLESISSGITALGAGNNSAGATLAQAATAVGKTAQVSLDSKGGAAFAAANGSVHYDFGGTVPYQANLVATNAAGTVVGTWPITGDTGDVAVGKVAAGTTFRVSSLYSNGQTDTTTSGNSMLSQNIAVSGVTLASGVAYLVDQGGERAPWSSVVGLD